MFGNNIEKVYITQYKFDDIEQFKIGKLPEMLDYCLRWDGTDLIVKYKNGNIIHMSNSEWASFEKVRNYEEENL